MSGNFPRAAANEKFAGRELRFFTRSLVREKKSSKCCPRRLGGPGLEAHAFFRAPKSDPNVRQCGKIAKPEKSRNFFSRISSPSDLSTGAWIPTMAEALEDFGFIFCEKSLK